MSSTIGPVPAKILKFPVDKDHYRRMQVESDVIVYHIYPTLASWFGRETPDDVNPRSHDDGALSGSVPEQIESTIVRYPQDFYLANRGETILAQAVSYDPERQIVELTLSAHAGDDARHGVADGGTTDAVIAKVQAAVAEQFGVAFRNLTKEQIPSHLLEARVHLEVIVGLEDRDRIGRLVQGRNTSKQVKAWTMSDFQGKFEWIKEILESDSSEFRGRIGYEENAVASVNILEVLAIATLFHPSFENRSKAPTVAYSSKGRLDRRLTDDAFAPGYKVLAPILKDVLHLHDHVYANFHPNYLKAFPNGKLGLRGTAERRLFPRRETKMALTGAVSEYQVPTGVLYPLLASLRALVRFPEAGSGAGASWHLPPSEFFDLKGKEVMEEVFAQLELVQDNPQTMGKTRQVYTSLYNNVKLILREEFALTE